MCCESCKSPAAETHAADNLKRQKPLLSPVIFFPLIKPLFPCTCRLFALLFCVSWWSRPLPAPMKLPIRTAACVCWFSVEAVNQCEPFSKRPFVPNQIRSLAEEIVLHYGIIFTGEGLNSELGNQFHAILKIPAWDRCQEINLTQIKLIDVKQGKRWISTFLI